MSALTLNETKCIQPQVQRVVDRVEGVWGSKGGISIVGWAFCIFHGMREQWCTLERAPLCGVALVNFRSSFAMNWLCDTE